jgi:outer membrane protein TolC
MNQTKKRLLRPLWGMILLGQLIPVTLFGQSHSLQLSLQAAVDSALRNNSRIRQYQELVVQKKHMVHAAKGSYFPAVNANGGYTWLSKNPEVNMDLVKNSLDANLQSFGQTLAQSGAIPANLLPVFSGILQGVGQMDLPNIAIDQKEYPNMNVTALQPIYMGGKIRAGVRFARADWERARQQLKDVQNKVTRETIKNYYGVVLLNQVIQTRKNVLAGMRKHEIQAEKAYKIGMISTQDLLRAKVAVANAERDLSDDQNKRVLAEMALKTNMGLSPEIDVRLTDTLKYLAVPLNLEDLQQEARLHQTIFKLIDQQEKMVQQKKVVDRAAFLPQLAAWGEYSAFQDKYPVMMPPVMFGVQAKINLFDGLKKVHTLKATQHQQKQLSDAREYTHQQVGLWVNQSYRKALDARERYLKLQPTLALSAENLKITEKRFQEGLSKSIDVIDSRLLDEKIKIERLQSLYEFNLALADVYLATGQAQKAVEIFNR